VSMSTDLRNALARLFNELQAYRVKTSDVIVQSCALLRRIAPADFLEALNRELTGYDGTHRLPLPTSDEDGITFRHLQGVWGNVENGAVRTAPLNRAPKVVPFCGMGVADLENQLEELLGDGALTSGEEQLLLYSKTQAHDRAITMGHDLETKFDFLVTPNSLLNVYIGVRNLVCDLLRTTIAAIDSAAD
jgi:hypothetical protein